MEFDVCSRFIVFLFFYALCSVKCEIDLLRIFQQ